MPLQATSGAASYDGFGGGVPFTPTYIEDVFSTWLYTGNGSTQTITNGIDVTGKGGLIWFKERASQGFSHALVDTARGNLSSTEGYSLASDTTSSQSSVRAVPTSSGFSLSSGSGVGPVNFNGSTYVSWTFRKQPKFFDVVTWTGNGTGSRAISHSLASTPGCIILKRTDSADDWWVVHRSASNFGNYAVLNSTAAFTSSINSGISSVGSTSFTVSAYYNSSGATWVAYIFGHDAGGFGLTGTDNVISCGSFTTNSSSAATVNLGYEPQWLLVKSTSSGNWTLLDNMRGLIAPGTTNGSAILQANTSIAEASGGSGASTWATSTGFSLDGTVGAIIGANQTAIYIAIRRGPMKTPTSGTSVYNAIARTGTSATATVTGVGFPPDLAVIKDRTGTSGANWLDRLRGPNLSIRSNNTGAEVDYVSDVLTSYDQNGVTLGSDTAGGLGTNTSGNAMINWFFRRAPGFFDEVCYSGSSSATTQAHNLGVVPEMMIVKRRNGAANWAVYHQAVGTDSGQNLVLNSSEPVGSSPQGGSLWNTTSPTSSVFSLSGGVTAVNAAGNTYVAYLFASCPGVSKVGNYTGNGSSQTINCGFTGGARWVLIKRTDSTGDWYVWDSTRGIVAGNDPRIRIGVGAAEDTTDDSIDTNSTGFIVNQDAATNINVSSASYIFLAIA